MNAPELKIFEPKIEAQRLLEESLRGSGIRWTGIITGPFFDWGKCEVESLVLRVKGKCIDGPVVAIPHGVFWVNAKDRKVTLSGSGTQRISMSRLDIVDRATVAVLSNPEAYANRSVYFADYTLSTNELLDLLEEMSSGWKVENVPVANLLSQGLQQWEMDSANGVEDRLNSAAYMMLGTYGIFGEHNRYGADFGGKVEKWWEQGKAELKQDLRKLVSNVE
jgi:hypothetical protein